MQGARLQIIVMYSFALNKTNQVWIDIGVAISHNNQLYI